MIGWMSNWQYAPEVPTMQFRSANTLPREIGLFRGADGEIYASSTPSPELEALRDRLTLDVKSKKIGQKPVSFRLPSENDGVCEILADVNPGNAGKVNLELSNSKGEKVEMIYDVNARTLSFDRRESGIVDFSQDFPAVTVSPTFGDGKR